MSYTKRIIPCLDIDNGRVVKGINFIDIKDAGDPVEVAKKYDDMGADEITFLDITATHQNRKTILDTLERVANEVFIPLTVGGGVSSYQDVITLLNVGADKVAINSAAVVNPNIINNVTDKVGSQCIVAAIDAKKQANQKWEVFIHGGRKSTGIDAVDWAKELNDRGAGELLVTSMDKDGTKDGFDTELLESISKKVNIPVIASGGAGELEHLYLALKNGKADAVLAASIFHYEIFTILEVKNYLKKQGVQVRI